jgi:hypothetical protein
MVTCLQQIVSASLHLFIIQHRPSRRWHKSSRLRLVFLFKLITDHLHWNELHALVLHKMFDKPIMISSIPATLRFVLLTSRA